MVDFFIVGFGNTLRSDDGLGSYLVETIENQSFPDSAFVRKVCLPQLDITLVTSLAEVDVAIFVDVRDDGDPEMVRINRVLPNDKYHLPHTTHQIDLPDLLSITETLYGRLPICYLVKSKGFDFSFSEKFPKNAVRTAGLAQESIYRLLRIHCDEPIPSLIQDADCNGF